MFFIAPLRLSLSRLPLALRISVLPMFLILFGEGLQHVVEYSLGMFNSQADFAKHQSGRLRMSFGIFKALCFVVSAFWVTHNLLRHFKPMRESRAIIKELLRLFFVPKMSELGSFVQILTTTLVLCLPMIWIHIQLNLLAIKLTQSIPILIVDTVVVALIALLIGTAQWAVLSIKETD